MPSTQETFSQFIALLGKTIEVGVLSSNSMLRGQVINAMFDSVLLETGLGRKVVRFDDIFYVDEISKNGELLPSH